MKIDKILAITLISLLVMSVGTVNADVFYTLKLKQEQRPSVCMFEPSPETTDNWELFKVATMMGIYEWEIKLSEAYPDGDWKIDVHQTIPWEEHEHKFATDYKQCNIMINFEKTNNIENSNAIGTTSIPFQNSNHKYIKERKDSDRWRHNRNIHSRDKKYNTVTKGSKKRSVT